MNIDTQYCFFIDICNFFVNNFQLFLFSCVQRMVDGTALLAGMDSAKLPSSGNHLISLRATLSLLEKMFFFYLNIVQTFEFSFFQ